MCVATHTPPAAVCTIGDCSPGTLFHGPDGENFVVLDTSRATVGTPIAQVANSTLVVDIRTGRITPVYSDIKLGYDERGRLYTSRFLNDWYYDLPVAGPMPLPITDSTAQPLPTVLADDGIDTLLGGNATRFPPDDLTGFNNRHED